MGRKEGRKRQGVHFRLQSYLHSFFSFLHLSKIAPDLDKDESRVSLFLMLSRKKETHKKKYPVQQLAMRQTHQHRRVHDFCGILELKIKVTEFILQSIRLRNKKSRIFVININCTLQNSTLSGSKVDVFVPQQLNTDPNKITIAPACTGLKNPLSTERH